MTSLAALRSTNLVRSACIVFATLLAACGGDAEGDDATTGDDGADEGALRAGNQLSEADVAALLRRVGFDESNVPRMVCTAKYESGFYERASHRNRNGTVDRGLFQVNSVHLQGTPGCPRSGEALFDAATNAACARSIYDLQGINAWYGYRAHRSECERYVVDAAPAATRSPSASSSSNGKPGGTSGASGGADCVFPTFSMRYADCIFIRSQSRWLQCAGGQLANASFDGGPAGACVGSYIAE